AVRFCRPPASKSGRWIVFSNGAASLEIVQPVARRSERRRIRALGPAVEKGRKLGIVIKCRERAFSLDPPLSTGHPDVCPSLLGFSRTATGHPESGLSGCEISEVPISSHCVWMSGCETPSGGR